MAEDRLLQLHYRYDPSWGYTKLVGPGEGDLKYLEVGLLRLQAGQVYEETTVGSEVALTILSGTCDIGAGDESWSQLQRRDPFRDWERPTTVYVPIRTSFRVEAATELEIAVSKALTDFQGSPLAITNIPRLCTKAAAVGQRGDSRFGTGDEPEIAAGR